MEYQHDVHGLVVFCCGVRRGIEFPPFPCPNCSCVPRWHVPQGRRAALSLSSTAQQRSLRSGGGGLPARPPQYCQAPWRGCTIRPQTPTAAWSTCTPRRPAHVSESESITRHSPESPAQRPITARRGLQSRAALHPLQPPHVPPRPHVALAGHHHWS